MHGLPAAPSRAVRWRSGIGQPTSAPRAPLCIPPLVRRPQRARAPARPESMPVLSLDTSATAHDVGSDSCRVWRRPCVAPLRRASLPRDQATVRSASRPLLLSSAEEPGQPGAPSVEQRRPCCVRPDRAPLSFPPASPGGSCRHRLSGIAAKARNGGPRTFHPREAWPGVYHLTTR